MRRGRAATQAAGGAVAVEGVKAPTRRAGLGRCRAGGRRGARVSDARRRVAGGAGRRARGRGRHGDGGSWATTATVAVRGRGRRGEGGDEVAVVSREEAYLVGFYMGGR